MQRILSHSERKGERREREKERDNDQKGTSRRDISLLNYTSSFTTFKNIQN